MIRLAIETATPFGSVALGRDARVLAEVGLGEQRGHADAMVPALDAALSLAGVEREEIGAVVVGAGPGSFTGVRVAAATAKGLVAALDVPLFAYSSLLALAAGVPWGGPVCALFDARRGEAYAGCWRVGIDGIVALLEPAVGTVEDMARAVASNIQAAGPDGPDAGGARGSGDARRQAAHDPGPPVLFVGDGAVRYRDALAGVVVGASVAGTGAPAHPAGRTLLWLAEHHPALGRVGDVAGWEPFYVRGSSAERGIAG